MGTINASTSALPNSAGSQPSPTDQAAAEAQLQAPDPTYPNMTALQVGLLQGIGTKPEVLAGINQHDPDAAWMDSYIQTEIMQDPEGWDQYNGNPAGTARAGLNQLLPGVQLPAAGTGSGSMPSDSGAIPGITVPLLNPGADPVATKASNGEGIIKTLVIGAVVIGIGVLAYKFIKGRNPAKLGEGLLKNGSQALQEGLGGVAKKGAFSGFRGMFGGGVAGAAGGASGLGLKGLVHGGGAATGIEAGLSGGGSSIADLGKAIMQQGVITDNMQLFTRGSELMAFAQGGEQAAAVTGSILRGTGAASGSMMVTAATAAALDMPFAEALKGITNFAKLQAGGGTAEQVAEGVKLAFQHLATLR